MKTRLPGSLDSHLTVRMQPNSLPIDSQVRQILFMGIIGMNRRTVNLRLSCLNFTLPVAGHMQTIPPGRKNLPPFLGGTGIKTAPQQRIGSGIFIANKEDRKECSMKLGTYAAALGSIEQQKQLDVIANNIANANTPGFKKDNVHFSNFLGEVTYTNMDQGPVRDTGNNMDIALYGSGFLKVQTASGTYFSRAGNMTLNSNRMLVNQDGLPVLGQHGPITILNPANLRIEENGQVFDGNKLIDTLDIVQFPPDVVLRKNQNGYFEPPANAAQPTEAQNCTVRQGALEGANFNPVEQMVKMVETSRNFEVYQKTMQTFDRDLDGQLISRLTA